MLRNVFLKSLRDRRKPLLWWSVGLALFAAYSVGVYPTIRDTAADLTAYLDEFPDVFRAAFLGEAADFTSPTGYLNSQFFTLMAPLVLLIFAISSGSRAVAGEEQAGTLEILLATPVPRRRVVLEKWGAVMLTTTAIAGVFLLALILMTRLVGMEVGVWPLARATVSMLLLSLAFGAIAMAIGCWSGRRGRATAVAVTVAIAAHLVNSMGPLVSWLDDLRLLSPFYYYSASDPLVRGLDPGHLLMLALLMAGGVVMAVIGLERRDLAV